MRQGGPRGWEMWTGRWWDSGSWWRWYLVRPIAWHVAGLRDRAATWRANRSRDIVR